WRRGRRETFVSVCSILKTIPEDIALSALLFQYGRCLLIASSRPGTQPANLQGIWNAELVPPWFSDYTVNINTEMNYWPAGPCNLAEMGEPLLKLCKEMAADGKETAENYFGAKGACSFRDVRSLEKDDSCGWKGAVKFLASRICMALQKSV
ncbi:MAG: hypothetical protein V8S22_06780, partial [Lachnospiraceae bacterium]